MNTQKISLSFSSCLVARASLLFLFIYKLICLVVPVLVLSSMQDLCFNCGMWDDASSLTRDQAWAPASEHEVQDTGPPGNPLSFIVGTLSSHSCVFIFPYLYVF